jgi:gliding motility-associated-like protein
VDGNVGLQATEYLWNDAFDKPKRDISEAGYYKLTASKDGCVTSDSFNVALQEIPVINLGQDTTLCFNDSIELQVSYPSSNYLWFDNSTQSNHVFTSSGIYWVESTLNGCAFRDSVNINYIEEFNVELGNDTIICAEEAIILDGAVGIMDMNYSWNTGNEGSSLSISTEGTYILEAYINQCYSSDTILILVQETPIVDLGPDRVLCDLDTVSLKVDYNEANFVWQDMQSGPVYFIDSPGLYWVQSSKNNCFYTDSIIIEYVDDFIPNLGSDTTICSNESIELSPGNFPDANFQWSNNENGQTIVLSEPGTYFVNVEIKGCVESDTINLDLQEAPDLELGDNIFACIGDTIKLESNVSGDKYNWNTGGNSSSISVEVEGSYRLEIIDAFCLVSDSISVLFNDFPLVELGPDTSICAGESFLINAGQLGIWQDGSVSNNFQASIAGIYVVEVENQGCISKDSIHLTVKDLPEFDLGSDRNACDGEVLIIEVPETFSAFVWENGSIEATRTFLSSTSIWLEVEDNGCKRRDSLGISFNELPFIELGLDTTICADANYAIVPIKSDGEILWPNGSVGDNYLVLEPGLILAEIENNGCVSKDSVFVNFRECVYFQSFIPNVFSPNRDGNNDYFKPQFEPGINILDYSMNIFDRWGNQVFFTRDLNAEWDGSYTSKLGRDGVYVYFINIVYEDDNGRNERNITGDILLIR